VTQFLFIFPFLQTNITSQMWPTGGRGRIVAGWASNVNSCGGTLGCLTLICEAAASQPTVTQREARAELQQQTRGHINAKMVSD